MSSAENDLNGSVLTGCGTRQLCRCSPFAAALFKSAVLPVPLKRNCRIKQKRQPSMISTFCPICTVNATVFNILKGRYFSTASFIAPLRFANAVPPQTLLRTDEEELCHFDTIPPRLLTSLNFYYCGSLFALNSLRKPKRCYLRSGQIQQSHTRHCRQCGCRHAHRR